MEEDDICSFVLSLSLCSLVLSLCSLVLSSLRGIMYHIIDPLHPQYI
jgi:hypothetical protein